MELTPEQKMSVERLYENESLTDNLVDQDAKALLEWAQAQIVANTDEALVRAAVHAANQSGQEGAQALVAQASTFLDRELDSPRKEAARESDTSGLMTMSADHPAKRGNEIPASVTTSSSDLSARDNDTPAPKTMRPTDSIETGKYPGATVPQRPKDSAIRKSAREQNAEKSSRARVAPGTPAKKNTVKKRGAEKRKRKK